MDEVKLLIKRAKNFLDAAKDRFLKEDYDLASFLAEQATQLYVKAALLYNTGEVPRSHSIRNLISMLSNYTGDEELLELSKKNKLSLRLLEHAYIASRYLFEHFDKDDAEALIKVSDKVFNVVKKLFGDIDEASKAPSKLEEGDKKSSESHR